MHPKRMPDGGDKALAVEVYDAQSEEAVLANRRFLRWRSRHCSTCHAVLMENGHGPSHEPSSRCQSGKRAHCTCDTCF